MPCYHKFYEHLKLDRITYEPETLIVGSFSPAWPAKNDAGWFYGRTSDNYFWHILPMLHGEPSLINATPAIWKDFCAEYKIALTDLIACVEDADEANKKHQNILGGFSDQAIVHNFGDFEFVDIIQLLQRHPSIRNVYLTRGIRDAFWRHLWRPVVVYANKMSLNEKQLPTPTESQRFQHNAYNRQFPEAAILNLEDYILMRWQREWHAARPEN